MKVYDMHFHAGWASNLDAIAQDVELGMLGVSITPNDYLATKGAASHIEGDNDFREALGLHPYYIGKKEPNDPLDMNLLQDQISSFIELAQTERYIGEIGLDFTKPDIEEQMGTFLSICDAIQAGSVLSIHCVKAGNVLCDFLTSTGRLKDCTCIFHWFSADSATFSVARKSGSFFSVNQWMLNTRKGKEYVRQCPLNRLLLETDYPEHPKSIVDTDAIRAQLIQTAHGIARIKQVSFDEIVKITTSNAQALLNLS